ncbi:IQ domain-containing protein IQM3-like [Musa acuminata AAA Group]|uniref:IQ domain-containing protein IQM3-like n=1 Tax=Musa acuminata AAA Group TaxID=214697 RepID=UPI0031DAD5D1
MEVEVVPLIRGSFDHSPPAFPLSMDLDPPQSSPDYAPAQFRPAAPPSSEETREGLRMETGDDGLLFPEDVLSPNPPESTAATRLQKVYRSYRTRRRLADSAVVAEELWWQAIDFARLNRSTVSFFDHMKPETAISRWNRISLNASKVGRGLSKNAKALKLAFQHWIEAIDPRHRYGHNLHFYYEEWCKSEAGEPFFYWLDIGDGRDLDLIDRPRSLLRKQCVKYLGPQEREQYEYIPLDGKIVHKLSGVLLDTTSGTKETKWIFVMSTSRRLYAGQKKKGIFHHSSFLAGGATIAAGRFTAENGILKCISAYSGHYRPTQENFNSFLSFLREKGVNLNETKISSSSNDDYYVEKRRSQLEEMIEAMKVSKTPKLVLPTEVKKNTNAEASVTSQASSGAQTLCGGLQSPKADVPKKVILERLNSKRKASSYQLGHQLSSKWCSGAGPRIGCVADYPFEVRVQALEFVNLSPRMTSPHQNPSSSLKH